MQEYCCANSCLTPTQELHYRHHCPICEDGIRASERIVSVAGEHYHFECLKDMYLSDLLILFGYDVDYEESPEEYGYDED